MDEEQTGRISGSGKKVWGIIGVVGLLLIAVVVGSSIYNSSDDGRSKYPALANCCLNEYNFDQPMAELAVHEEIESLMQKYHDEADIKEPVSRRDSRYTEEELLEAAKIYYIAHDDWGYIPSNITVDHYDGDEVLIHLYDISYGYDGVGMTATYDWYWVDIYTGVGRDFDGNTIDIMNP